MRVAIVGSGIAGLACARALAGRADVTVLEAADRLGGHVYTHAGVDLGFIVFSRPSYPGFSAMLDELGVASRATTMSFSVSVPDHDGRGGSDGDGALAWSSASPRGWFAQPRNLVRASHWRFLGAVVRLLGHGRADLGSELVRRATLDEYLAARRVPAEVRERFVVPLAAALWSLAPARCGAFPAETWLRFLDQHGMLRATRPHPWRTVVGGSATYVEALVRTLGERVRIETASPVTAVHRRRDGVGGGRGGITLVVNGRERAFDRVVLATHADTALALLAAPTASERAVLGAFTYSHNPTVLHGDASFLPAERAAWASWNYVADPDDGRVAVTYWMNRLQGLPDEPLRLVTLNPRREPAGVLARTDFMHPQLDFAALDAQRALPRVQGAGGVFFAGAYAGFGFHEDGFRAGVRAAARVLASASEIVDPRAQWSATP
ncbi:MAG TPA: FAD-dependent oxidoreductase [Kofleriaceae bacterium]|nr:FAD-dependent oxidoreductase [Kofleriaceae bacterium]